MITKTYKNITIIHDKFTEKVIKNQIKFDNITIICADAGNSFTTYYALLSFYKYLGNVKTIILCQVNNEYLYLLSELSKKYDITLINNFNNELNLPYSNGSKNHSLNLNYLINMVKTDYIILCDNDIIVNKNIASNVNNIINNKYDLIGVSDIPVFYIIKDTIKIQIDLNDINNIKYNLYHIPKYNILFYNRILPYCVILNLSKIKNKNIPFYLDSDVDITMYISHINSDFLFADTFGKLTYRLYENNVNMYFPSTNDLFYTHIGSMSHYNKSRITIDKYKNIIQEIEKNNIQSLYYL